MQLNRGRVIKIGNHKLETVGNFRQMPDGISDLPAADQQWIFQVQFGQQLKIGPENIIEFFQVAFHELPVGRRAADGRGQTAQGFLQKFSGTELISSCNPVGEDKILPERKQGCLTATGKMGELFAAYRPVHNRPPGGVADRLCIHLSIILDEGGKGVSVGQQGGAAGFCQPVLELFNQVFGGQQ